MADGNDADQVVSKKRKSEKRAFPQKIKKSKLINDEIEELLNEKAQMGKEVLMTKKSFDELPLSKNTKQGLKEANYHEMTPIQQQTLALALHGEDILGAAKTGSGKTLAFLVPVLELLYLYKWNRYDGMGAVIITPTRELALQIFETLKKIGRNHDFLAGLIIGGKDLKFEWDRMDQCNIVICTPGRLLHHLDQNPVFDCSSLKMLILDEADRILEMGFAKEMNSILDHLPKQRQTLLFSATQRKSVKDLARLSLMRPKYVSVDEKAEFSTPQELKQFYMVCNLENKVEVLWTFIKRHVKQKCIVFFSSSKQVRFLAEVFKILRPGTTILTLYGRLHQLKRMDVYEEFCRKNRAILFATDLAARGLDFPDVNWVIQVDCPEDAKIYIHRVGRTARMYNKGESLLLLMPSEKNMLLQLQVHKVPISEMKFNANKVIKIAHKMNVIVTKSIELTSCGDRALVGYFKAKLKMKNSKDFDVQNVNLYTFAASLGLPKVPNVRFLQKFVSRNENNSTAITDNESARYCDSDSDSGSSSGDEEDAATNENNAQKKDKPLTKEAQAKFLLKRNIKPTKIVFGDNDTDKTVKVPSTINLNEEQASNIPKSSISQFKFEHAHVEITSGDKSDKEIVREKKIESKIKKKEKLKKQMTEERSRNEVRLAVQSDNDDEDDDNDNDNEEPDSDEDNEKSDSDEDKYDDNSDDICND